MKNIVSYQRERKREREREIGWFARVSEIWRGRHRRIRVRCTRAHDGVTAATRVVERETLSEERNERTREETKEREVRLLLRSLSRRLSATTRGVNTTIVVIVRSSLSLVHCSTYTSHSALSLSLSPVAAHPL